MKLNTIIKLPDGRIGTICYHNLDGYGGVWGKHAYAMPPGGFGDNIPKPEFMLRDKLIASSAECVGEDYEIIKEGSC